MSCFNAVAQGGENSPFSRFGIGDIVDESFYHLRSMGSLGSSFADDFNINIVNPASYAKLKSTSFDIGLYAKYARLRDNADQSSSQWSGNLEYISLAFPLSNPLNAILEREQKDFQLGMAFTLMPNSTVSYDLSSTEEIEGLQTITRNFEGSGGTYKFYWGNALSYKDFSIGANLGYAFGNIEYERNVVFSDLLFPYNSVFTRDYSINGFIWKLGAQYSLKLNERQWKENRNTPLKKIVFGIHGNSKTSMNTTSNRFDRTVQVLGTTTADVFIDTIALDVALPGTGTLPGTIGFGASYHKGNKFSLGFDFQQTSWSKYENEANPETLNDTYRISVGGHVRPNSKSFGSYFKRAIYRYGFYYQTDPRELDNKALTNAGVTLGMGLPFIYQRKISHANIGVNLGRRGQGSVLTENFARILISFTFNDDEWFIKRKYD